MSITYIGRCELNITQGVAARSMADNVFDNHVCCAEPVVKSCCNTNLYRENEVGVLLVHELRLAERVALRM